MNALILSVFPYRAPFTGGQHRLFNIERCFKAAGFNTYTVGVCVSPIMNGDKDFIDYPNNIISSYAFPFPDQLKGYMVDYCLGEVVLESSELKKLVLDKILEIPEPDVIFVELPWLFKLASYLKTEMFQRSVLIYGSENIEYSLKAKILAKVTNEEQVSACSELIRRIELDAITSSDVVLAVSQDDCKWFTLNTSKLVLLAPNGVQDRVVTQNAIVKFKKLNLPNKYILYTGSDWPPNVLGLYENLKYGFGSLTPDQKLVIVGNVCDGIKRDIRFKSIANFYERSLFLGKVDEETMAILLDRAHAIAIPIIEGGGTNLKTAEALWSGKYIIATPHSFRGFEEFMNSEGVFISKDDEEFRRNLRYAMSMPTLNISASERHLRESVLWDNTLKNLQHYLKQLVS